MSAAVAIILLKFLAFLSPSWVSLKEKQQLAL